MSTESGETDEVERAVLLDYLPHGHPSDSRPQSQKQPAAYGLTESDFRLVELTLSDDAHVNIGDRVVVSPRDERDAVTRVDSVDFEGLSNSARNELEYAIRDIVEAQEDRFVDFYNDAQPITLRLHQLNLLPGIGKKLRNNILDERKRQPFESFEDIEERVSGLHNPKDVLIERIVEEIREEDLKYKTFVQDES